MSEKKRDKKGRILREGERQRQDGRYEYRYTDVNGKTHSIYSTRLVDADPQPSGAKHYKPLRELEAEIRRDIEDNIDSHLAKTTTLNFAYERWIATKVKLKPSTQLNYKTNYDKYIRNAIGNSSVKSIKTSQLKKFYIDLQRDKGLAYGTIKILHKILRQVFSSLVIDGVIRLNPATEALKDVEINGATTRHALSLKDQQTFETFVQKDAWCKRWIPLLVFLFGTGVRIGEACAITWADVDFYCHEVRINKTAIRVEPKFSTLKDGYTFGPPKTQSSLRTLPMLSSVEHSLAVLYEKDLSEAHGNDISNWLVFRNRNGDFISPEVFTRSLKRMCRRCNKMTGSNIPEFTPHVIRHTFCVRLWEMKVDMKVIQAIMGHKSITVTMDIYNEATNEHQHNVIGQLSEAINADQQVLPKFLPISTMKTQEDL